MLSNARADINTPKSAKHVELAGLLTLLSMKLPHPEAIEAQYISKRHGVQPQGASNFSAYCVMWSSDTHSEGRVVRVERWQLVARRSTWSRMDGLCSQYIRRRLETN